MTTEALGERKGPRECRSDCSSELSDFGCDRADDRASEDGNSLIELPLFAQGWIVEGERGRV